jgi:hypothetical protein
LLDWDYKVFEIARTRADLAAAWMSQVRYCDAKEITDQAEDLLVNEGRMRKSRSKVEVIRDEAGK